MCACLSLCYITLNDHEQRRLVTQHIYMTCWVTRNSAIILPTVGNAAAICHAYTDRLGSFLQQSTFQFVFFSVLESAHKHWIDITFRSICLKRQTKVINRFSNVKLLANSVWKQLRPNNNRGIKRWRLRLWLVVDELGRLEWSRASPVSRFSLLASCS